MLRSGRSNESGSEQVDLLKNQYPPKSDNYFEGVDDKNKNKGNQHNISHNPPLYVGGNGDQLSLGMGSNDSPPPPQYRRPRYPCFPSRKDGYGSPEGEHPTFLNPGGGLHYSYVLVMALLFSTIVQLSRGGLLAYEQKKHNDSSSVDPIYGHGFANIRGASNGGASNANGNNIVGMNGGYYGWSGHNGNNNNNNNNNMASMQRMGGGGGNGNFGNNMMGPNQMGGNNGGANNMMMQGDNNNMMSPSSNQDQFNMMNQNNNMMSPNMNTGMMNQNQNGFMNGNGMTGQNNYNMMQPAGQQQMMMPQGQGQQNDQQKNNNMMMMQQQQQQNQFQNSGGTMMFPDNTDLNGDVSTSGTTDATTISDGNQDETTASATGQTASEEQPAVTPEQTPEEAVPTETSTVETPAEEPETPVEPEPETPVETLAEIDSDPDDPLIALKNFKNAWEPWEKSDVPVFFHIPKSGGSTIKDVMGTCHRFVMASEAGVTDGHIEDTEVAVVYPRVGVPGASLSPFINVDTTTVAGIQRAKEMGFADSGLADAVVTPFIYESNELFTQTAQGRLFCVFRHPIDRAISLYYYLQVAEWEPTYDPDLKNWSIEQYAQSDKIENNWLTRQLSNQLGGELTDEHVNLAMEVIRRKFLVGLMTEMKETMTRLERFFHWTYRVNPANQEICREDLLSGGSNSNSKNKKDKPQPGSEAYDLLAAQNQYDLQVYGYIENLFQEQEQFFADTPEDIRNVGATCCKCDPPTFPEEGFECPEAITDEG